jgi:hypothetical protein
VEKVGIGIRRNRAMVEERKQKTGNRGLRESRAREGGDGREKELENQRIEEPEPEESWKGECTKEAMEESKIQKRRKEKLKKD